MARKAVLKRIKFTGGGKLRHRRSGKNHLNAKASRRTQLREKGMKSFSRAIEKKIRAYI
ncbi:MAG: 50S ribosomal protein L35 [Candidatus Sungbacteria bacterium]|uniref:50S ribosomal protein L35 n=1 Tax=Candidatus Sungiibacteriota bacterium TaxID=2750080 RepID=A0A932VSA3_9BACT|nr:50S ribosomal protein L35 [Candidatus Sungbacteria bacterium]